MIVPRARAMAGTQHECLRAHLFPGDGLEAAAVLLCSSTGGPSPRLLVRDALNIPYAACSQRRRDFIAWPGAYIESALDLAEHFGLTLVLIHSHPGGQFRFSSLDDRSDLDVMPGLLANHGELHCSAIMTPDGAVRARCYDGDLKPEAVELVTVAGHDISYWWAHDADAGFPTPRPIAFTSGMTAELGRLTAMVVGVSGTGSLTAEQALRLGFKQVKLVDYDRVEFKNINRIVNSKTVDAHEARLKVEMFAAAAAGYRGRDAVEAIPLSILSREAVLAAGQCDVLLSCVDSLEARQVLDLVSSAFLLPLFDVGVVIPTRASDGMIAIGDVCGRIDYVQPGRSSLRDRGVYTPESLRAEYLRRNAPDAHRAELEAGYIKGLIDEAPGVISLNMRAAAACMNEFIARAYPYRHESNSAYARTQFSLAAGEEDFVAEDDFRATSSSILGRGTQEPLLGLPFLASP
jgi:proteasome lid subunit RPN8/RPN11